MQVQLDRIIIFNFKSFKGEVTVGPIKPFTAIIGANGSGKSNIMDAISFVMGEKAKSLRVKQLNELIYGTFRGIPIGHRAYVTAVFVFEDSSVETFTRTIYHTSSEYKINDQVVAAQLYMSKLRKLNLNVTTKNFLVFQGAIDSTLMKTPKEYTHMFEEISNSIELKEEYERLKNEIVKEENEIKYLYKSKKDLLSRKKYVSLEKKEADKYKKLHNEYLSKKTELYLFELFHIQKDIEDLHVTLKATELKLIKYKTDKDNESDVLKERKRQLKIALETLENIEQDLFNLENGVKMKQTNLLEAKEKVSYCEQKFNSISRKLSEARELNKSHLKAIKELMQRKDELMQMKSKLEEDIATHLLSQGSSIQFNDIQVEEYFHLKQTAGAQCSENIQVSISLKREQSVNQNKLDNENRKKYELEATLQQKSILKGETERRIKRLQQCMDENQDMLTNKINTKYNLENMIVKEKKDVESIQQELQCLSEQLDSAKLDKFTTSRLIKGEETIKILQNLFTGVYDRLYKLCKPIHPKYDVAMTKVLGKYCNSIIVSTNKVAVQCINYLKEQKIGTETFLPVESLKVEPIKKNLRGITNPKNVKLLYDVLNFEHREINNVILFVTKNTLVCETSEDAIILADEMEPTKINCVTLDGTYYTKHGIISGGQVELLKKAEIWNEKNLVQLKSKKIMLMEELRKKMKISQNESEIITLDVQIQSLTNKLNYCRFDLRDSASVYRDFFF
ncbi:structural maintenance of chromosomes protein 1A-like [Frieseomelitta varia]|uniref:structural maintenance of chromosomes protein 1A-like n=1 Tax=Frieseomelitta varia TaxID=561572 RepID=UPI001CB68DF6|nr:structural maintenance of chromosomes protein 1A-like [Frieseomelitta varia]